MNVRDSKEDGISGVSVIATDVVGREGMLCDLEFGSPRSTTDDVSLTTEVGRSETVGEAVSTSAESPGPTWIAVPMIAAERTSAGFMNPKPSAGNWRSWLAGVPSPNNGGSNLDVFSFDESPS